MLKAIHNITIKLVDPDAPRLAKQYSTVIKVSDVFLLAYLTIMLIHPFFIIRLDVKAMLEPLFTLLIIPHMSITSLA
jgi:hypothetical protein